MQKIIAAAASVQGGLGALVGAGLGYLAGLEDEELVGAAMVGAGILAATWPSIRASLPPHLVKALEDVQHVVKGKMK